MEYGQSGVEGNVWKFWWNVYGGSSGCGYLGSGGSGSRAGVFGSEGFVECSESCSWVLMVFWCEEKFYVEWSMNVGQAGRWTVDS